MMHTFLTFAMLSFALFGAEKKPVKAPRSDPPAGAVKVAENHYRYTDAQGKTWLYRKTPFGWSKREETAETAAAPRGPEAEIRVLADGDVVKFEKPSPFGVSRWERKADELTADEKNALARYREQRAAHR
jgi:hypothetical protein